MNAFEINTSAWEEENFTITTSLTEEEITSVIAPLIEEERESEDTGGEIFYDNKQMIVALRIAFPTAIIQVPDAPILLTF
jgi:hypothetical protein